MARGRDPRPGPTEALRLAPAPPGRGAAATAAAVAVARSSTWAAPADIGGRALVRFRAKIVLREEDQEDKSIETRPCAPSCREPAVSSSTASARRSGIAGLDAQWRAVHAVTLPVCAALQTGERPQCQPPGWATVPFPESAQRTVLPASAEHRISCSLGGTRVAPSAE